MPPIALRTCAERLAVARSCVGVDADRVLRRHRRPRGDDWDTRRASLVDRVHERLRSQGEGDDEVRLLGDDLTELLQAARNVRGRLGGKISDDVDLAGVLQCLDQGIVGVLNERVDGGLPEDAHLVRCRVLRLPAGPGTLEDRSAVEVVVGLDILRQCREDPIRVLRCADGHRTAISGCHRRTLARCGRWRARSATTASGKSERESNPADPGRQSATAVAAAGEWEWARGHDSPVGWSDRCDRSHRGYPTTFCTRRPVLNEQKPCQSAQRSWLCDHSHSGTIRTVPK